MGKDLRVCGQAACRAILEHRLQDVRRVWLLESDAPEFGFWLRQLASLRIPYHLTDDRELAAVSSSTHHEGIVLSVARKATDSEAVLNAPGPAVVLALAGVQNPHNLGAIVRSAAHFGARAVMIHGEEPRLEGAALRTAEGGGEHVPVLHLASLGDALSALSRRGWAIVGTSARAKTSIFEVKLPEQVVVVLGGERQGLPAPMAAQCTHLVAIPGTGNVESLNVAASAAVMLAELWRRR